MRGRGAGEEKELAHFLTRPFKHLSSRLSASGLIRLLLISWKSRIKDQGSVENISNKLPLRDSGFPGKAGSRIKDQGSWFLIRLLQETGCYYDFCFFNTISFYVYNLLLLLLLLLLCCHVSMFTSSSNKAVPIKLSCLRESSLEDRIL